MSGGLLRYQLFLAYGGVFMALWYAALQNQEAIMQATSFPTATDLAIRWAPLWGIVALGLYALIVVGQGMLTFQDFPEAVAELERQVKEARAEMKKRGIPM
jgi:dolichyl-phosphate mannosyltransferase polypeptide 3